MRALLVLLVIGGLVLLAIYLQQSRQERLLEGEEQGARRYDDMEIVPASESRARAERAMPETGTENRRDLLIVPALGHSSRVDDEHRDYGPKTDTEWVVEITFAEGRAVDTAEVDSALGRDWLAEVGGAWFYGFSPDEGRWTYLHAKGAPTRWTRVAVCRDLVSREEDEEPTDQEGSLNAFLGAVRERAEVLGPLSVVPREELGVASARARRYGEVVASVEVEATIVLAAPEGGTFAGEEIWDVMYSLGLLWGDMDIFHWENPTEEGDDYLFSVWTTTEPGYFLPELIADGQVRVETLVFGFTIPRSMAPEDVYREMLKAAKYAQQRLGGQLLSPDGAPLDGATALEDIQEIVSTLAGAGITPGSETALRIF